MKKERKKYTCKDTTTRKPRGKRKRRHTLESRLASLDALIEKHGVHIDNGCILWRGKQWYKPQVNVNGKPMVFVRLICERMLPGFL